MHENILKKTNLLYRYCVIYFNFLSIGMHALEYCRMYELRHMTYRILSSVKNQYFGPAVLELCAHSGTTDVRALKQASRPFDRGALRLLGTSGKFSPIFAILTSSRGRNSIPAEGRKGGDGHACHQYAPGSR